MEEDIADLKDIKPEINGDVTVKSKHVAKKAKLIKNPIIGKLWNAIFMLRAKVAMYVHISYIILAFSF